MENKNLISNSEVIDDMKTSDSPGQKHLISIELLHLVAGFSLVVSGILVYFIDGFEMALSWAIFGAMYISMSDVGENEMSEEKLKHRSHLIRRLFGYVGALLGVALTMYYIVKLLN